MLGSWLQATLVSCLAEMLYNDYSISVCRLQTTSKFSGQEFEEIHSNIGSLETPVQVHIPPIIMYLT